MQLDTKNYFTFYNDCYWYISKHYSQIIGRNQDNDFHRNFSPFLSTFLLSLLVARVGEQKKGINIRPTALYSIMIHVCVLQFSNKENERDKKKTTSFEILTANIHF